MTKKVGFGNPKNYVTTFTPFFSSQRDGTKLNREVLSNHQQLRIGGKQVTRICSSSLRVGICVVNVKFARNEVMSTAVLVGMMDGP